MTQKHFVSIIYSLLILLMISCNQKKSGTADEVSVTSSEGVELIPKWTPRLEPNPHPDAQWFPQAAFGLFMHWGIVSGSPDGQAWDMRVYSESDDHGWRPSGQISPEIMFERADIFNPDNYRPDRWLEAASAAGFRYAVLTARHHDAYFLGESEFGDWHAGNYIGRDLIEPYVEACRNNDIRVGFYFSAPDWYHGREYQSYNYPPAKEPPFYNWKHEKVDFIPPMPDSVKEEVDRITRGQIHELFTNYGKVDLLWTDGVPDVFSVEDLRGLKAAAIWGRGGEYATPETWADMKIEWIKEANRRGYAWELCDIINKGTWHWSEEA